MPKSFQITAKKPSDNLYQEPKIIKVLLVEDNPGDARLVKEMLVDAGANKFSLAHVGLISEGLSLLREGGYDVVLLDLSLPDGYGLDTIRQVCAAAPHLPVVILTGLDDETIAIRAVQEGAQDYLVKGQMDSNLLARAIRYAIERKRAEEKLRESEERFRQLAENIREAFYIYEEDTNQLCYISPAYKEIWGCLPSQSLYQEPKSLLDAVYPEDKDRVKRSLGKRNQEEVEEVYRIVRPDGSIRWIKDRSFPVYDSSGKMHRIVGIAADITDHKMGEEKLKYLSLHDSLTGLYNRIYFEEEINRIEKARYDTVGVVSCDVDGLKLVNDTLGHDQGDHLLVAAARVIRESFRDGDLVARIGGDEFSVILPNTTESAVENACQRIQEAVANHNALHPELPLSISIGFAVSNGVYRNIKDLFKDADNNMYLKKLYYTQNVRSTIVNTLINTLKTRDLTTERHVTRLEKLLVDMASLIGLPESTTSDLSLLAKFHDIGKVGVSDSILCKKGALTSEEWIEVKRHCEIGYRIALSASDLIPVADWILKHHEWWNGDGYPLGIKGEEIPIECRLLAITEAYEAMTSVRPYRRAFFHGEAVAELLRHSGTQFDPELLEKFVQMLEAHPPESETDLTSAH
jgi:diguanylate cyclase (GGDEF)-like protein/PAS domain S-box-containing protein